MTSTSSDRTSVRRPQAALLENQQILEALISSSFEAIIAIDQDRKVVKFNRQAETLLGYDEAEVIGKSVLKLHADRRKAREIYYTIQESGEIERMDVVLLHKDGREIPISLAGKLIKDEDGHTIGQVGFIRDLRELHLFETRLRALVEASKIVYSSSGLREILEQVIRSALSAIPSADNGSIHFYDERDKELKLMIASFDYARETWEALHFKAGKGIAGWVYEHQEPVLCGKATADRRYQGTDNPDFSAHGSILCVPISSKRTKIGVMSLTHASKQEAFSSFDRDLLVDFAEQAAVAIERAEEITTIKKEAEELDFLRAIGIRINAHKSIEEILNAIMESGNKLLGTEMAVVHWKTHQGGKLQTFVAPEGMRNLMTEPRQDDGLTAEIFQTGKPVIIPNTAQDPRVNPQVLQVGIQSIVGYPLHLHGEVTGVLFFNSQQQQFFGEHETHLISLLLPLAAVAINNTNSIELNKRSGRLAEALVQVSSKLAATHELPEQMAALKQFMQDELAAPMFYLGLYNETDDTIELKINCEDCADLELFDISLKDQTEWTISSFVLKKQTPIVWLSEAHKQEECRRLGISPLKIGSGCKTCLAYPLAVGESVLGVISIQSQEPYAWDEIEGSTFQTLAHQASIAIRNSYLMQEVHNSFQQINKVRDTAMLVAEGTALGDLDDTLRSIVNGVKNAVNCDSVTLYTFRQEKNRFDFPPKTAGKLRFPSKVVATGTVDPNAAPYKIIGMDEIYVTENTQNDPILRTPFARRERVFSTVAVPLKTHTRRVGVLFINYCHKVHTFTNEELANIRLFSHQAAIAISNAMLYEDEQKRREVLRIIDEAGRTVTSTLHLDEIFDTLAHQAYDLTGESGKIASFATITLVQGDYLSLQAAYPLREEDTIIRANLARVDLGVGIDGKIGIIGKAVKGKAPVLVKDVQDHPDYLRSNPGTRCELAVPIIYRGEVVGVINVEHEEVGGLDDEDLHDIQMLAAHAAVAIQNARIHQALLRKTQHQQALYEASKIINANIDRTQKELLDLLVEQMVTRIIPMSGANNILGAIHLYDEEKDELKLESTYPPAAFGAHRIGEVRSLADPPEGKIGITGLTVLEKKPQRIDDVTRVSEYLEYSKSTKSELDVPMLERETVLGVLSLESARLNGFDEEAEEALLAFSELATIALQNTRRYHELKETRATVGNITAVAWMGLVAGAWRHSIGNMATTISDLSQLAQMELGKADSTEKVLRRLKKIQELVKDIQKVPMPPLSSEAGVETIYICQLVRDRINQFRNKKERYGSIDFETSIQVPETTLVRASPEWIRRILDILIDNASNAMKGCESKEIRTVVQPRNEGVEILIADNGRGIPDHIRPYLFKGPIPKGKDEKGSGIGLFLANSIIHVYGGFLKIHASGPGGTAMALWLPVIRSDRGGP